MQTLQLSANKARELYPTSPQWFKETLEESLGKEFFSQKITDRVESFDDILAISGITIESLVHPNDTPDEIAYKKVKLICEVYNEGWSADWANVNQYKYIPYFTYKSGFGLSCDVCVRWFSDALVGSRLCFKSAELAEDAGKKFREIYHDLLN